MPEVSTEAAPRSTGARARVDSEDVLCVPRITIFPDGAWHGLITKGLERVLRTIRAASHYSARHLVEEDASQQQIIPYCVAWDRERDLYLLTRRLKAGGEQRLHDLYSLGIGGHINPLDAKAGDPVLGGLQREWSEEVVCQVPAVAHLIAVLNDDSSPVSSVHLGLVCLVEVDATKTRIREQEKLEGEFLPLPEIGSRYSSMEAWSQLTYDFLTAGIGGQLASSPLVIELAAST